MNEAEISKRLEQVTEALMAGGERENIYIRYYFSTMEEEEEDKNDI